MDLIKEKKDEIAQIQANPVFNRLRRGNRGSYEQQRLNKFNRRIRQLNAEIAALTHVNKPTPPKATYKTVIGRKVQPRPAWRNQKPATSYRNQAIQGVAQNPGPRAELLSKLVKNASQTVLKVEPRRPPQVARRATSKQKADAVMELLTGVKNIEKRQPKIKMAVDEPEPEPSEEESAESSEEESAEPSEEESAEPEESSEPFDESDEESTE